MTEKELSQLINQGHKVTFDNIFQKDFAALMSKVYLWMTFALLITGFAAFSVANSVTIVNAMVEHRYVFFGVGIAELALVFILSSRINRFSLAQATVLFILYSLVNGVTMSFVFLAYTQTSIIKVFLVTAVTFGIMAFYGFTTKKDLTSIGRLFFFGLIGLLIATIVNIFVRSTMLDLLVSYAGVLIFVGLTAWDTQKIKRMLLEEAQYGGNEHGQKIALLGAFSLYLDFINLFLYLIRIMGNKK